MTLIKNAFLAALILASTGLYAQNFNGFRSGNYSGVNGAFFNPANIADNRYKIDVNLISISTSLSNDQASFSIKKLADSFDEDSIKNQLFGKSAGPSSGIINMDLHGPSFMFAVGPKMGFALTSRARMMGNISHIDGKLAQKITDAFFNDPSLPYTVSSPEDMRINVHAWTEFGLGIGRVISDKGKHFFKAGVTLKYLGGAGSSYLNIAGFNGTITQDPASHNNYLQNASGQIAVGSGGVNVDDFDIDQLTNMKSSGFGADIGFVYEFRPTCDNYRVDADTWQRDMNKYKLKIGVSLLDIGSIKYDREAGRTGNYMIDINNTAKLNLGEVNGTAVNEFKSFFDSKSDYFTPVASGSENAYKVPLPTSLHVDADYHFNKGLYVNLEGILAFKRNSNIYNNYYYSSFIVTPRFEGRALGFYLPVSYDKLSGLNAGASVRLGPLFFGSSSALTALFGDSKQIDVHFGLRFGGMYQSMLTHKQKKERKDAEKAAG